MELAFAKTSGLAKEAEEVEPVLWRPVGYSKRQASISLLFRVICRKNLRPRFREEQEPHFSLQAFLWFFTPPVPWSRLSMRTSVIWRRVTRHGLAVEWISHRTIRTSKMLFIFTG